MLAVSFLQWWYLRGWLAYFDGFRIKMRDMADFFSIGLLLRTLFQPFRQISADETGEKGAIALLWPCIPLLPFVGIVVSSMGVVF